MEEKNNPQEEVQSLLSRLSELLNAPQNPPAQDTPQEVPVEQPQEPASVETPVIPVYPTIEEIASVVNKAVEFRPMEPEKEFTPVEKFLFREGGPLSRYTEV